MPKLSIVIPSRNEMFLGRTVQDILEHLEDDTEVIVGLDGVKDGSPILSDPRVNVIYVSESIGQRAMTNLCVRLSKAKYIMKVDAHCSFAQGFDRIMIEGMKDDWTMVPTMRNLWAFSWKCYKCGWKKYQGPTPEVCPNCGETKKIKRKMMWIGKERPQSNSYCFDQDPHFQYANEFTKRPGYEKGIVVGYKLSFYEPSFSPSVISLLTDFADSHSLTSCGNYFRSRKNVSVDTMGFSSVNGSGGIGINEIESIRNKSKVGGITTSPILTNMVNDGDILSSTSGDRTNKPSISNPVCESFLPEVGTPTISTLIYPPFPIPAPGSTINTDVIQELNGIIGGEFVYNEKTSSFHNKSVALSLVYDKGLTETMSLQGSCFMLTRDKYWELNISDESLGSWGSQGIEVACKTWLSGGRVLVNHDTWYAHMFRTQGGDFGFPYEQSGKAVQKAKSSVRELFYDNKWEKQVRPLSWLLDRFAPVPGWSQDALDKLRNWPLKN